MKMIYAIVHDEDSEMVIEELNKEHFSVTKISTTGGFLRKGSTTLMIGTEDDKVKSAIDIIKKECLYQKTCDSQYSVYRQWSKYQLCRSSCKR